ncbi:MAG: sulfatase-like hydrolase/transferase [Bacteroidetes bacterium]|nr:sulfatase-like hydrolase/transferase [Bacteroidota bacterium]
MKIDTSGLRPGIILSFFIHAFLFGLFTEASAQTVRETDSLPNVVFILSDDQGWVDLACYGSEFFHTPNIDSLAARGISFSNAYSANPFCSPTRASVLTGIYPARSGLLSASGHSEYVKLEKELYATRPSHIRLLTPVPITRLDTSYTTIAEVFREAGYATGHFGKWHLGTEPYSPLEQGFDVDIPHNSAGWPLGGYFSSRMIQDAGLPVRPGEHVEDRMAEEAVKWMRENKDRPFLLHYWAFSVHGPYAGKADYVEHFEGEMNPDYPQRNPIYAAMVKSLDDAVGRLVDSIDALGLRENTIIVFASDNGGVIKTSANLPPPYDEIPVSSNAPLRAGKGSIYEGGSRVPTIFSWPGKIEEGASTDAFLSTIDFFPTLLDACGLAKPEGLVFDGVSQLPVLEGGGSVREEIYDIYPFGDEIAASVRRGDWKLIRFFCGNKDFTDRHELYDLGNDIGETTDLSESHPDTVTSLVGLLDVWLEDTETIIPVPNPAYVPPVKPPDVLVIFADDMGFGDLGCYGATKLATPNIDRLAEEGIRFTNAYVSSSTCSQSRYALMSGRYWWHSSLHPPGGVVVPAGPNILLEEGVTAMPEVFREKGYETAVFGKWHLGFGAGTSHRDRYDWNQPEIVNGPLDVGFNHFFGIVANVNNEPSLYIENRNFVGRNEGDMFTIVGNKVTPWSPDVLYEPDEVAGEVTRKTVEYIQNAEEDTPLFLYYASIIPHKPITPAPEFIGSSECGLYGDFIQELDAEVGMLIDALEESGRLNNTLILFASDNGAVVTTSEADGIKWGNEPQWEAFAAGHLSNSILRAGKHSVYEGGNRIPFIAWWPGEVPANQTSDELFSLTDVFPSLCGILDMPYPEGNGIDGIDQHALLLTEGAKSEREFMPSETSSAIFSIRYDKWKMVEHDPENPTGRVGENTDQLFDLDQDPSEQNNIFNAYPEEVDYMKNLLESVTNPDYEPPVEIDTNSMNVLLLMTDQHSFSALGAAGNVQIQTPNLDRLTEDGAYFTHCIVPTPDCSPARASILTGLSTNRHGIWNNVEKDAGLPGLDDGIFPVTEELLYDSGYNTFHWGKLHVNNNNTRPKDHITAPWHSNTDFACYETWPEEISGKRDAALASMNEAAFNRGYPDWDNWSNPEHVDHVPVINQAMSSYVKDIGKSPVPAMYTREFAFGEELMEAMSIYRNNPWMFTLSYNPPHKPWNVPDPYYGMYDPDSLLLPANQDVSYSDALAFSASVSGGKEIREKGRLEFLRTYYAQITMVDEMIGEVLDHLEELGLQERTLIVFTSDHGDMAGSHAAVGNNLPAFFESQIRVPLIVRFPGRIPGETVIDELVTPMDIMPTILDYAGYADLIPGNIDGSSLRPLIDGDNVSWRDHVIGMRDLPGEAPGTQYMIRNKRWKYWWNSGEDLLPHLYDLEADPLEKNNLAGNQDYHDMQMELHNALTDWVKENQARQHEVMEYMEPIVGMESKPLAMTLQIHPNPATDHFTLHFSSRQAGEASLRLFDISGRLMRSDRLEISAPGIQSFSGSTAGLASGTYYIILESETSVETEKLIITDQ